MRFGRAGGADGRRGDGFHWRPLRPFAGLTVDGSLRRIDLQTFKTMNRYAPHLVRSAFLALSFSLIFPADSSVAQNTSYETLEPLVKQIVTINSVSGNANALEYADENEVLAKLTETMKSNPQDSRVHALGAQLAQVLIHGERLDAAAALLKASEPLASALSAQDFAAIPEEDAIFLPLYSKTARKLVEARTPIKEGPPLTEAQVDELAGQLEALLQKADRLNSAMYREKGAIEEVEAILAEAKPIAEKLRGPADEGIGYSMRAYYAYEAKVESVEETKWAVARQGGAGISTRANRPTRPGRPRPQPQR